MKLNPTSTTVDPQKLRMILRKHLRFVGHEEIPSDEKNLYELGLDSLSTINLLLELEQAFECAFTDEVLNEQTFQCFNSLRTVVEKLLAEKNNSELQP